MKECKKIMNRILSGKITADGKTHLQNCADCRSLAAISGMFHDLQLKSLEVPAGLDKTVLDYAKQKRYNHSRALLFIRKIAIPLAACFIVCAGLAYNQYQGKNKHQLAAVAYDPSHMDSELMVIYSELRTSSENVVRANVLVDYDSIGD